MKAFTFEQQQHEIRAAADRARRRIRRAQRLDLSSAERMTRAIKNDLVPNELPRVAVLQHWFALVLDSLEQLDNSTRASRAKRRRGR